MRVTINEPDGRISGIITVEVIGLGHGKHFRFKDLQGKTGKETMQVLQEALDHVTGAEAGGLDQVTQEKVVIILNSLLDMARKNPEGTWQARD